MAQKKSAMLRDAIPYGRIPGSRLVTSLRILVTHLSVIEGWLKTGSRLCVGTHWGCCISVPVSVFAHENNKLKKEKKRGDVHVPYS